MGECGLWGSGLWGSWEWEAVRFGGFWHFGVCVLGETGIGHGWILGDLSLVGVWDLGGSGFWSGAVIWAPVFGFWELWGFGDRTGMSGILWDFGSEFGEVLGLGELWIWGYSGFKMPWVGRSPGWGVLLL